MDSAESQCPGELGFPCYRERGHGGAHWSRPDIDSAALPERLAVEIRPAIDPLGRNSVLLQFREGWLLVRPTDARKIAAMLLDCADEVESG